jgi:hypothetical protein
MKLIAFTQNAQTHIYNINTKFVILIPLIIHTVDIYIYAYSPVAITDEVLLRRDIEEDPTATMPDDPEYSSAQSS